MKLFFSSVLLAAAMSTTGVQAGVSASYGTVDPGGAFTYSFEDFAGIPGLLSFTGGTIFSGDVANLALAPQGGSGNFWSLDPRSVPGTSPGEMVFATALTGLSFLWGSPDSFNDLTVHLGAGGDVPVVPFAPANGVNANSRYLSLTATDGDLITGLTFKSQLDSQSKSFEVDNLSMTPVPEPQTYALLLAGLAAMSFVARRRKPG